MQKPEETAAEAVAECLTGFGFKTDGSVVQNEFLKRIAQVFVIRTVGGINSAEYHGVRVLIAVQRLLGGVCRKGYRVANFGFGNGFNGCGNVSDFAGGKLVRGLKAWGEHADFRNVEFIACVHEADSVACTHNAVHDAHIAQRTLVIIVKTVKNQCTQRLFGIALRRGKIRHDARKHLFNVQTRFRGNPRSILGRNADNIFDFLNCIVRIGGRKVDFVDYRQNFKPVIDRKIDVCKSLRFNSLRCVNDKHRSLTGSKCAADFVSKVNMPRSVYKVEHITFSVGMGIKHAYGGGFYRDAALALDVHGVQKLLFHVAARNGVRKLHQPVRKGGFAVINMRNDAKIPD